MRSPHNDHSRLAKCPVCAKDVHKVLITEHVELCLSKSRARSPDDASASSRAPLADADARANANANGGGGGGSSRRGASAADRHLGAGWRKASGGPEASTAGGGAGDARRDLLFRWAGGGARHPAGGSVGAPRAKPRARPVGPLSAWVSSRAVEEEPEAKRPKRDDDDDDDGDGDGDGAGTRTGTGMAASAADERDDDERECDRENERECDDVDEDDDANETRAASAKETAEALGDAGLVPFNLRVMSGNRAECGICLQPFSSDDGGGDASARPTAVRHVFWPCQHVRQCGECAIRIWQTPKAKRRCPWCKSKIEIRPRAFKPFL